MGVQDAVRLGGLPDGEAADGAGDVAVGRRFWVGREPARAGGGVASPGAAGAGRQAIIPPPSTYSVVPVV